MSGLGVKVATGGDRGVDAACTLQPGLQTAPSPGSSPSFAHFSEEGARLQLEKATLLMDTGRMLSSMHTRLGCAGRSLLQASFLLPKPHNQAGAR